MAIMIEAIYEKVNKFIESNQISLIVFFGSMFIFITFSGTRLFISDEGVILDQFYNFINGSLVLKAAKIDTVKGMFISVGDNLYGKFSYSLLIFSLPAYYILKTIDLFYGAHIFLLQLWAISGGVVVYLIARIRNLKHEVAGGIISYFVLVSVNLYFFKPIYFPRWGEVLSIEFTNILISCFLVLIVYLLFKNFFSNKIAIFASFFVILATPISLYAITLKHHSLAVFLTLLTFYLFLKYYEKKNNTFIYLAYISTGLCIWTRILDGVVLLATLLITDIVIFRRGFRYIMSISIVILISLMPFFGFNHLIQGDPFSIIENSPITDKYITLFTAKDYISLEENQNNPKQAELLNDLGYIWNAKIRGDWLEVLGYSMFFKLINTFGIFLFSPFLIAAFAFIVDRVKWKIKLNTADKLLGLYTILLFGTYGVLHVFFNVRSLLSIITDTPFVLEYRYLLIMYVVFLYFSLRTGKIRELLENNYKKITFFYIAILIIIFFYFIVEFPVPVLSIYYYTAIITSTSLLILASISVLISNGTPVAALLNRLMTFVVALSLAEASFFLLFYYWVASMTYISPSQNYTILPVLQHILNWMYQIIL